jgi:hypothetical protein
VMYLPSAPNIGLGPNDVVAGAPCERMTTGTGDALVEVEIIIGAAIARATLQARTRRRAGTSRSRLVRMYGPLSLEGPPCGALDEGHRHGEVSRFETSPCNLLVYRQARESGIGTMSGFPCADVPTGKRPMVAHPVVRSLGPLSDPWRGPTGGLPCDAQEMGIDGTSYAFEPRALKMGRGEARSAR